MSATPYSPQCCPSSARTRPRRACDCSAGPGMPGVPGQQWQTAVGRSARSRRVPRALVLGAGPGAWGQGGEKSHQWDSCVAMEWGARGPSQESPAQAHLPFSFLDLPMTPSQPPQPEELACQPTLPCPSPSFRSINPGNLTISSPAPPPALLRVAFQRPLPGLTELSAAWAVTDQGMCWWLLEATDLVLRADGNCLGP